MTGMLPEVHSRPNKSPAVFYGWVILAVSFITITIAYSSRWAFSVFYVVMLDEFGWSHGTTAAAMSINLAIYTLFCPVAGVLFDRFGARKVVPIGAIILGFSLVACTQIDSIWQLYLLFGITAIGTAVIGIVPNVAVLSKWFVRRRGLVMGIAGGGLGLGMVLSPYTVYLISTVGWRNAFLAFAAMAVLVIVPLAAILLRDKPEDKGLAPDGIVGGEKEIGSSNQRASLLVDKEWGSKDWTLAKAAQTFRFWGLLLANLLFGMTFYTLSTHQVVYLIKDVGFSPMFVASIFGFFGICYAIGGIGGFVSDRIGRETTFSLSTFGFLLGIFCLLQTTGTPYHWLAYLYAVVTGLSGGFCGAVLPPVTADLFAGRHFGAISGMMIMTLVGGGAVGAWAAGIVRDETGAFSIAFMSLLILISTAAVLMWLVAPRKVIRLPRKIN